MHLHTDQVLYGHNTSCKPTHRFDLHCHPYYECYYFISGDVRYLVEGMPYTPAPHSVLLMASGVLHGIQICSDVPYERITLHFDAACLPEAYRDLLLAPFHAGVVYYEGADAYEIAQHMMTLETTAPMEASLQAAAMNLHTASLLAQLCHMHNQQQPDLSPESRALDRQIIAYINTHLTGTLTLDSIARHFFISRNQLCRSFAQATGTTIGAYIRSKRLMLAQQLRASGQSASEAATNAGFADYSTYYRTHRRLLHRAPTADVPGRPEAKTVDRANCTHL